MLTSISATGRSVNVNFGVSSIDSSAFLNQVLNGLSLLMDLVVDRATNKQAGVPQVEFIGN